MRTNDAPFALVTGVSRRIGFALAERCAAAGFDLLVAAPDDCVDGAAARLRSHGGVVEAVRADLGDPDGVDELYDIAWVLGRPVDALLIGPATSAAAADPARGFLDETPAAIADALDRSVLGPVRLAQRIGRDMRRRGAGRILFACAPPPGDAGPAQSDVVTTTGANTFLAGFALALGQALDGSGVTVTYVPPQPPCAGGEHGREGRSRAVARLGFEAMMRGEAGLPPAMAAAVAACAGVADAPPPESGPALGDIKLS